MPRPVLLLVLAAAALLPGADGDARAEGAATEWPYGAAAGPNARRRDLYNLGILGAKARDAERTELVREGSGRREFHVDPNDTTADDGPPRLRVEILFPGGPAAKAKVQAGDVITGVNGTPFTDQSLAQLARALVDAESGKAKGVVRLSVERGPEKTQTTVDVTVPVAGKDAETPLAGKFRDGLVARAADLLGERQQGDGGFPAELSATNGAVVQTCLAGLVWLASGSDLQKGPHAKRLRKAAKFVVQSAGAEPDAAMPQSAANWSQVNWAFAHEGIFLGELLSRSSDAAFADALRKCGETLAKNQEKTGGWAHGPGGANALGYIELNIVSGFALCGMGLAQRAGYEPPADVVKKAEEYLVASGPGDGGVGYSNSPKARGAGNIGRTAGAWLGMVTLGQGNSPAAKGMEGYVREHAGDIFDGHASLMQHFMLAGVAAHAQGGDALTKYWKTAERDMVLARAPDGSFQPRPFRETLAMASNTDVTMGELWTTAAWAIVLGCEAVPGKGGRPGLPAWMGKLPPAPAPKKK